jgi:hypothetical protein
MGRPNQRGNSGALDQANSAYLSTIQSRAVGSYCPSCPKKGIKSFGRRRIYQLGADVPDADTTAKTTGTREK